MSEDRDKLKSLLLGEEIAQIKAIQKLLDDRQAFTEKVSQVLDNAADQTIKQNPEFQKKFSRLDPKALTRAIKANQKSFIDAMIPIMGPMIRQSVANAISKFVQDVNRAMEQRFSIKALRWRWQAYRTGISFTEIVFSNTIEYQVQQVFLIDKESGLLIEHAGHEDALMQDKEAISAMLTAIESFVQDSMGHDGSHLSAAKLGERNVEVISGSQANLAVVIKGAYTPRLVDHLSAASEQIHIDFASDINDQNTWNNNPDLKVELENLLVTKSQSDDEESSGVNFWPWLIIALLLIGWFSWRTYQQHKALSETRLQLAAIDGLVVQQITPNDDGFLVTGLLDPLADTSTLSADIRLATQPYVSLDDELIANRVRLLLNQPDLEVEVRHGLLTLTGHFDDVQQHRLQRQMLGIIPGISQVDDQSTARPQPPDLNQQLLNHLQQHPLPEYLKLQVIDEKIVASGELMVSDVDDYWQLLNQHFEAIDASGLTLLNASTQLKSITSEPLNFIATNQLSPAQQSLLNQKAAAFLTLHRHNQAKQIKLIAQSDCQGSLQESNANNRKRGTWLAEQLVQSGVDRSLIQVETILCEQITTTVNTDLIGVWFEVNR
ncbi:BON domain-containing protein [Marinicella sediminis]|uniref:BON domain-containing protein n=1 Tax=Marinicella sediminis TaxID=1792834 RepID=A0ABV7JEU7_9GAMM|nr:BON domain-containing protein [Marinicella sediminis]